MGLQLHLNECVGEGELDGMCGGDLGDYLLYHLPCPHPGGRVGEVMPDREISETKMVDGNSIVLR